MVQGLLKSWDKTLLKQFKRGQICIYKVQQSIQKLTEIEKRQIF